MLHFQLEDGRLPQQINWRLKKSLTDPLKPRLYSKDEYNDLTQMPVLPSASAQSTKRPAT